MCAAVAQARARRGAAAEWVRVGCHTCAVCENRLPVAFGGEAGAIRLRLRRADVGGQYRTLRLRATEFNNNAKEHSMMALS